MKTCSLKQRVLMIPRHLWLCIIGFYTIVPYTQILVAILPLYYYNNEWYYTVEEYLYKVLVQVYSSIYATCGHTGTL